MEKKDYLSTIGVFLAGVLIGYMLCCLIPVNGTASTDWASRLTEAKRDNENLKAELKRSSEAVIAGNKRITSLETELRYNGERLARAEESARYAFSLLQDNDQLITEAGRIAERYQQLFSGIQQADKSQNQKP